MSEIHLTVIKGKVCSMEGVVLTGEQWKQAKGHRIVWHPSFDSETVCTFCKEGYAFSANVPFPEITPLVFNFPCVLPQTSVPSSALGIQSEEKTFNNIAESRFRHFERALDKTNNHS